MSAPARFDGTGCLVDAIACQTMLETGGLDSMVRGFREGVKPREGASSARVTISPDEAGNGSKFRRPSAPLVTRDVPCQGIVDRTLRRPGSSRVRRSGSACHWGRHAPHPRLPRPVHHPATSRRGKARRLPEPSASGFRSTGNAHVWSAYLSKTTSAVWSCSILP